MDKIEILLRKLDNKVTAPIAKRLDGYQNLLQRVEVAKKDLEANPEDEELKEAFEEITDYISDYREDLIEDLEELVEAKEKQKQVESKPKVDEKPKVEQKPKVDEPKADEPKEEKSTNVAGFIIGGVLLVASLGAINYFRNNR
jgi:ABC-type Na+ efflux pump permease subunit